MSDSEKSKNFSAWFGSVTYGGDFSLSEKPLISTSSELSDQLISTLSSSQNIRLISSLKPVFKEEKPDYRALAKEAGLADTDAEYVSTLREIAIQTARKQLSASMTEDKKVIQAVEALDDLNETINHLTERLTEWYSAYYPELDLPGEAYVRFVSEIPESASQSLMGAPATHEDLLLLQSFADDILSLYERKAAVESFIEMKMKETAPNLSQLAGVVLGARLLSMAGGLKHLAAMPSGSIQVMGAEKAMVKHLRSNAPSPKHGTIFSHPILNTAPFRLRGKIARSFAAAVSLSARTDYYSGTFNPKIESDLNTKINRIKQASSQKEVKE
ncbi:NOP5/NOP56 family protein [Methanimicrococcus blatticola]|uniref:rRNA biogenesis protein Nop56/Nop58 n=1 Tax=Methanimicrococcus blatticola TaxID=91560 RepID=A0A484F5U6_9EURY|nr:rRNA biogenesis protein [Methanimicrococcus blatticola]MBZ3936199.1 rRNA biogenesis protein [Methanimicrococcus blatticola]MCC2508442.1 rRNA biogenesis protein [Methanimicrococcus blatticola]TDQ70105.1 rRNA biogenesis protein Nop56/Nop58 [Methanimicrococcus blatticola]